MAITAREGDHVEIDHVVLAARSREQAEQVLSAHGLAVARGRVIPGFGVSNLVVPLGRSSLEIHYPNSEVPDSTLPPIAAAQAKALDRYPEPLVPVAWLVGFEDVESLHRLASQNNLTISDVPEEGPGYPAYTLAGFGPNMIRRWLPALIHWPVPHEERPHALTAATLARCASASDSTMARRSRWASANPISRGKRQSCDRQDYVARIATCVLESR
jgi:hypothetical protein